MKQFSMPNSTAELRAYSAPPELQRYISTSVLLNSRIREITLGMGIRLCPTVRTKVSSTSTKTIRFIMKFNPDQLSAQQTTCSRLLLLVSRGQPLKYKKQIRKTPELQKQQKTISLHQQRKYQRPCSEVYKTRISVQMPKGRNDRDREGGHTGDTSRLQQDGNHGRKLRT